jgi:hypothetical protein
MQNDFIRTSELFDVVADFDAATLGSGAVISEQYDYVCCL